MQDTKYILKIRDTIKDTKRYDVIDKFLIVIIRLMAAEK